MAIVVQEARKKVAASFVLQKEKELANVIGTNVDHHPIHVDNIYTL